jgi:hypothetical protein
MSHKLPIPTKTELEDYYDSVKSISKTAKHFKTTNPTVRKWLIQYDIKRYTQKEASLFDTHSKMNDDPSKEDLLFAYKNLSLLDIRNIFNIGQERLYTLLDEYGIEKIDHNQKVSTGRKNSFDKRFGCLSKDKIEEDYTKVQCMGSLAQYYKCSMTTIKKLFKMYEIEARFAKSSRGQNEIVAFIESLGFSVKTNDRKLIYPLEVDILIEEKKIAIEYCGIFYHSETGGNKSKDYHQKKHNLCKEKGYNLITIFESDWKTKPDIVMSIISTKLGVVKNKIYARNTEFRKISYSDIKSFEDENHMQGSRPANEYYGLYHDDEIVMSISFGKSRFNKNYEYEIIRMTTKKNTLVVGGASKLFSKSKIKNCITYADNRYGTGKSYEKLGFIKIHESAPNYFYFHKSDHDKLYSRNKFQKHKIPNVVKEKSEYENMLMQGYDRIWDCGNTVYVFDK